jgi:hypothetical protein
VDIPPEVAIKSTIKCGSVYYFPEETLRTVEPHYFIVLNMNPLEDMAIILACSSSRIEKVKARRRFLSPSTLVEISPVEYPDFTVPSIIDCNFVLEKTITQLVEKLASNRLRLKTEMNKETMERIRNGVKNSVLVDRSIKRVLLGE